MADISKIKILDGTEYDIKDAVARATIASGSGGSKITISDTEPSNPQPGDTWFIISTGGVSLANGVSF